MVSSMELTDRVSEAMTAGLVLQKDTLLAKIIKCLSL